MKVLIFGSGSLVRSVCYALPAFDSPALEIVVAARSAAQVFEIVAAANIRSSVMGAGVRFTGIETSWEASSIEQALYRAKPNVILHVASLDSPWHRSEGSVWADLIRRGGFCLSLPLQAALVTKVARVATQCLPDCALLNASYPDTVNPVLKALGLNVLCGVGNVAILAAAVEQRPGNVGPISMLAHHSDLSQIVRGGVAGSVRLWDAHSELAEIAPETFESVRQIRGEELNQVTGATIAKLLSQLSIEQTFRCHVPGPLGYPGGYPVQFSALKVKLDLPKTLTFEQAFAHNQESARSEGVFIEKQSVNFVGPAAEVLHELVPDCPISFPVAYLDQVAEVFSALKNKRT